MARTAVEEKTKDAEPAFLTLKTAPITLPLAPLNPGVGNPPFKDKVPALLEKLGSSTHKENIDPDLLIEIISKRPLGKFTVVSALFISAFSVLTKTLTVKTFPTVKLPDYGLK